MKQKLVLRSVLSVAITNLTMWFRNFWKFLNFVGRILKSLEIQTRKALEYRKQTLMGNSSRNSEDQNADRTVGIKEWNHEVSEQKEGFIENWTRGYLWSILAKKLSAFYPCSKIIFEDEFKCDRPINLAEKNFKTAYHSSSGMDITSSLEPSLL